MFNVHYTHINNFKSLDNALHYACCRYDLPNNLENVGVGSKVNTDQIHAYEVDYSSGWNGLAWKRLDDRYNTLFGSTYEVPIGNYQTYSQAYRIWIYGDSHLQYKNNFFGACCYPSPEDIVEDNYLDNFGNIRPEYYNKTYRDEQILLQKSSHSVLYNYQNCLSTLGEIVSVSYPNAIVTEYGDFSSPKLTYANNIDYPINKVTNDLKDLILSVVPPDMNGYPDFELYDFSAGTLLSLREIIPTHIVVNGLERCCELGIPCENSIKDLVNLCTDLGIRLVIVTDPFYQDINNYNCVEDILDKYVNSEFLFDLTDWMNIRDMGYSYYFDNVPLKYVENDFYNYLPDFAYNAIIRHVLDKWQLPVHRDRYFVSLVRQEIDETSYMDWFRSEQKGTFSNISSGQFLPKESKITNKNRENDSDWGGNGKQHHEGKYGKDDSFTLFMNNGEFVAIILHTDYDESLHAHEQFQANTNYEYLMQTDTASNNYSGRNLINVLPSRLYVTGAELYSNFERSGVKVPVYPTTGAPWFVMSNNNVEDYKFDWNAGDKVALIDFWLSFPNDRCCTISLRVRGNCDQLDNWQSISFGLFSTTQTANHVYPLYCAGGSLGISDDIYQYTPIRGSSPTSTVGNSYDLDFHNICLSHSNLLHPTKMNGSEVSNFKVLSSEGIWRNIFAHIQEASTVNYPNPVRTPDFAIKLEDVVFSTDDDHFLYPTGNIDTRWLDSSKYINSHGYNNFTGNNYYKTNYIFGNQLIPVCVALNSSIDLYESMFEGEIPGVYCTYDCDISSGEYISQDGTKYLVVPCGWDGRLYNYGSHFGVINDEWEADVVVRKYENITLKQRKNVILDKLVIRLR